MKVRLIFRLISILIAVIFYPPVVNRAKKQPELQLLWINRLMMKKSKLLVEQDKKYALCERGYLNAKTDG